MTATCTRLVAFAGPTPNPRLPADPQALLVQGVVAVRFSPYLIAVEEGNVSPNPDFWDVLVNPLFDKSPYVVLHEAELQDTGQIVIKRDLFGPGDYPHTWSGWPIPGDPPPGDALAPVPQTIILNAAEKKALALVKKAKNGAKAY